MSEDEPIVFSTEMTMYDGMTYKLVDPRVVGRRKVRMEGFHTYATAHSRGILVHHERHIDRNNNRYHEKVDCPITGEVLHECDESLSQHVGHGADKKNRE